MAPSSVVLDGILDQIYDAASAPEMWPQALNSIVEHTGGAGSIVFGFTQLLERGAGSNSSVASAEIAFEINAGLDAFRSLIFKERHFRNPWSDSMWNQPAAKAIASNSIVSVDRMRRSAFFDEVLWPQRLEHNLMAKLGTPAEPIALNILRPCNARPFAERDVQMLQSLIPHLQRAFLLQVHTGNRVAPQTDTSPVLDALTSAVFLLSRSGKVVFMNQAAMGMVKHSHLCVHQGALVARQSTHRRELEGAIRQVAAGKPSHSLFMGRVDAREGLTVFISSLRGSTADRFMGAPSRQAAIVVFVTEPFRGPKVPLQRLMDLYGLTRSEARVAILSGGGALPREIAERLGLSSDTIKTHLKRVFIKCRVRNQADLVRLVSSAALIL